MAMNPIVKAQLGKFREANPNVTYNESDFFEKSCRCKRYNI